MIKNKQSNLLKTCPHLSRGKSSSFYKPSPNKRQLGFTIVELLIVIVVIGTLAATPGGGFEEVVVLAPA